MSHSTILIAGGTGFIGQALVADRLKSGDAITVLGRDLKKIKNIFGDTVAALAWTELSAKALTHFDIIINLTGANIGAHKWTPSRKQEIINSRVKSTQTLAAYCAELGTNAPRLLNASAIGIYGLKSRAVSTEKSIIPRAPFSDFLNKVGYLWEQATTPAKQAGVNVVTMRFGVVLAHHGGMLQKLMPVFKFGLGGKVSHGRQIISWVSLSDLIRAIDFIITHPELSGPINIVAPTPCAQIDFAQQLAKSLRRPCFLPLPSFMVKLMYGQMGEELLLQGKKVKPEILLQKGFKFSEPTLTIFLTKQKETI